MQIRLIVALVISILAVFFALQNATPVTVNLLVWQFQGSLAVILLISLMVGVLLSLLISMPATIKRRRTTADQHKRTLELEKDLADRDAKIKELEARLSERRPALAPPPPTPLPEPSPPKQPEPSSELPAQRS